jgi:hypothetical protein
VQNRGSASIQLRRLATAQAGVLTTPQALGLKMSRHTLARLAAEGIWQRLAPGLYLTKSGKPAWDALAWGGVLLGGPGARLGGTAAAFGHGLIDDAPAPVEVLVPHGSPPRTRLHWSFVHERAGARSPKCTGSPPRLLVPDTVLDLCDGVAEQRVVDLVTTAVQRRLTTPEHLRRALGRRARHAHRALLADLLTDVGEGAESPLEIRFLRDVERAHGLPRAARQVRSADGTARRDAYYEEFGVLVELDGRRGHEGADRFRDMRRDNAAVREALVTLRYGFGDVAGRPCAVAGELAEVLTVRGWTGILTPCPVCPPPAVRI